MQKSVLHLLLKKVSDGDLTAAPKLCSKMADRLVHIPTLEVKNEGSKSTKISVIRVREGERALVPLFTTQQLLKNWLEINEIEGDGMSLLCADVCMALESANWIMIDAGTDYWVELEPRWVQTIAQTNMEDDEFLEADQWSLREKTEERVAVEPEPQQEPEIPMPQQQKQMPINATQEVPIVPHPLTVKVAANPSEKVTEFPALARMGASDEERASGLKRFRQNDEDDVRATMDLSSLRQNNK